MYYNCNTTATLKHQSINVKIGRSPLMIIFNLIDNSYRCIKILILNLLFYNFDELLNHQLFIHLFYH